MVIRTAVRSISRGVAATVCLGLLLPWIASIWVHAERIDGLNEYGLANGVLRVNWDDGSLTPRCALAGDSLNEGRQRDVTYIGRPLQTERSWARRCGFVIPRQVVMISRKDVAFSLPLWMPFVVAAVPGAVLWWPWRFGIILRSVFARASLALLCLTVSAWVLSMFWGIAYSTSDRWELGAGELRARFGMRSATRGWEFARISNGSALQSEPRVLYISGPIGGRPVGSMAMPIWPIAAILAISVAILWRFDGRRVMPGHCWCGYDLTGNVSGICPECGREIHADPRHAFRQVL